MFTEKRSCIELQFILLFHIAPNRNFKPLAMMRNSFIPADSGWRRFRNSSKSIFFRISIFSPFSIFVVIGVLFGPIGEQDAAQSWSSTVNRIFLQVVCRLEIFVSYYLPKPKNLLIQQVLENSANWTHYSNIDQVYKQFLPVGWIVFGK